VCRQAYYNRLNEQNRKVINTEIVLELVRERRTNNPKMGGKKLFYLIHPTLQQMDIKLGRDHLFDILRANKLLVVRKRSYTRTTHSLGWINKYKDHYNKVIFSKPNKAWVSDITYIRVGGKFYYLFLITDAHSRKIVGWNLAPTLETKWGIEALEMAIRQCKVKKGVVHHSDRGFQYTSKEYTKLLGKHKMVVSMGQVGNCYDNAMAERVNGILKDEYLLDSTFKNIQTALSATKQAIKAYNYERPHMSLNMKIPFEIHDAA
jgi:putative transposase